MEKKMAETRIVRETFEWSNNWWDHADDSALPRVLLIGDSISCGYGPKVIKNLEGRVHVDRMANSRGVHDPILFKEIRIALENYAYKVIHFNNGLHALHLSDEDYRRGLEKYVDMIHELSRGAAMIWASSTPITQTIAGYPFDEEKNDIVIRRNAVARTIMNERNISINDLYSVVVGKSDLLAGDGYHYNDKGYEILGKVVANAISEKL
jgi:lysophospholipase L1-like esterase